MKFLWGAVDGLEAEFFRNSFEQPREVRLALGQVSQVLRIFKDHEPFPGRRFEGLEITLDQKRRSHDIAAPLE